MNTRILAVTSFLVGAQALFPGAAALAQTSETNNEVPSQPAQGPAEANLEWFWLSSDVGYQQLWLQTLRASDNEVDGFSAGLIPSSPSGPSVSFGLGAQLTLFVVGVRATLGFFNDRSQELAANDFQLATVDLEFGAKFPVGRFEPRFLLAGGYATFGGLDDAFGGIGRGLDINGANFRLTVGFDFHITKALVVGADIGGGLLALSRRGVPLRDLAEPIDVGTINEAQARILEGDETTVGASLRVSAGLGLHF